MAVGDRAVHGWNPSAYATLLGVEYKPPVRLSPAELGARLDRILASAERAIAEVPERHMDYKPPERDRSIRDLTYHLFRLSLAFVDAMDTGSLPEVWLQEKAPGDLREGAAVARYGALVRGRISGWFEGAAPREFSRTIDVYYGPQSGHDLLERTAWHAAQHLRQLYALLEGLGTPPRGPLPSADFEGLPLPASLW
ncbi:MAG TPA: DinB family protein [Methylomirabilota bacterium]|nr:DinB family protein [Methylomirabilota bacterium]